MMTPRLVRPVLGVLLASTAGVLFGADAPVDFGREIRPILSDKCFRCHGNDARKRKADLRLDERKSAFAPRDEMPAITPGSLEKSSVWLRITTGDEKHLMPPPDSGKDLNPTEIDTIRRWIESGADWQEHWSFVRPVRPPLPVVDRTDWPRNSIDFFILATQERAGLAPAEEADPASLFRRATLDLTGLPPAPDALDAFLADDSPGAWDDALERLLESPHYGEHMARMWLDAARYGDTHGLHLDNFRSMWPYRDWVIDAFNRNLPYDRFTIEQLAGDLLPEATLEQRVATGFNRCNVTTSEGGSIDEEFYVRYAVDRVETTATVFLGLTAGCAVCHNHKFDPLSMQEFYRLFAFFNNITENAMDGNAASVPPVVDVPMPGVAEERGEIAKRVGTLDGRLAARGAEVGDALAAWIDEAAARSAAARLPEGQLAHFPLDGALQDAPAIQGNGRWAPGRTGDAFLSEGGHLDLGDVGAFEGDRPFSYGAWIHTPGGVTGSPLARMDVDGGHRGWDIYLIDRRVAMHLIHDWSDRAIKVTTKDAVLEPNRWHHVFVTYDGSGKASGVKIWVDGQSREYGVDVDNLAGESTLTKVPLHIAARSKGAAVSGVSIDDVRLFDRELTAAEVAIVADADPIAPLLAKSAAERTDEDVVALRRHFLESVDEIGRETHAELARLRARDAELARAKATTLVMEERKDPRGAYVLIRGQYDQRGAPVEPGTPAALPPFPEGAPRNRLGLAQWIASPHHPLTARVAVNRLWQQAFGHGLVRTPEDFGSQGDPPSHPALLDWLATEFVRTGWDVKRMQKLIRQSATYLQATHADAAKLAADPQNRLLTRAPRHRLDAETIRDQALALSGLLVDRIGGPSVKPPQPAGLWYAVGYTSSNTARFTADSGPDIYRRSTYTFWKRTSPPPQMAILDAPSREACTVRRERTNTPLQALLLLNEPQLVEAARHMASRALRAASDDAERVSRMFRLATARSPEVAELDELLALLRDAREAYESDPESATRFIAIGESAPDPELDSRELAAWTLVANLILNLDEVICRS